MLRISSLFAFAALMFASVNAETIVSDNLGNTIGLPLGGGNATGAITNTNSMISTSPYMLNVFINNGVRTGNQGPVEAGSKESFYMSPPNNNGKYGNATLIASGWSPVFSSTTLTQANPLGQFLGSSAVPVNVTGLYQFTFTIPVLRSVFVELTYINSGAPQPVVDLISILVSNPAVVVGDPQFVGLRGQSFQVHGIDGAVYNIITEAQMQVNARFAFLEKGECPVFEGVPDANCWSHPGSYLGEMSFQQIVDGKLHQLLVTSGSAKQGFAAIVLDGRALTIGDSFSFGEFSVSFTTSHRITVQTEKFSFELANSDMFINQAVANRVALSKLNSHGLLGQTHAAKIYNGANRYIAGEVDDYVIADNDIFGTSFAYNKFNQ